MLRQEELESVELLRDTLDVVQTINTYDDLATAEALLELLETRNDLRLLQTL